MKNNKLDFFKNKLLQSKQQILNSGIMTNTDDMKVAAEDLSDEADLATNTINQQVSFSIRERELSKLRRIERALSKIEDGTYGICEESGDAIEIKRLENQPWAEYCLEVAEEFEREQAHRFRRA